MKKDNEWGFYTLPTQIDPEKRAIERLKIASELSLEQYGTPLVVTTSGGKDSSVCVELALRGGIPFEVQHNHTTADAPETVRFVRREFARLENLGIKCTVNYPTYKGKRTSMWGLIPQKLMPPTRMARYCCEVLKEHGGDGRFVCTGVRWGEEYREVTEYWHKRIDSARTLDYKQFKEIFEVKIRAGYNSKSPTATLRVHLTLGKGVQEWGAEPYKDYYILQILEVQKIENWSQGVSK